jgi:hypothetical protein
VIQFLSATEPGCTLSALENGDNQTPDHTFFIGWICDKHFAAMGDRVLSRLLDLFFLLKHGRSLKWDVFRCYYFQNLFQFKELIAFAVLFRLNQHPDGFIANVV